MNIKTLNINESDLYHSSLMSIEYLFYRYLGGWNDELVHFKEKKHFFWQKTSKINWSLGMGPNDNITKYGFDWYDKL